jgi:hypothetical protein
MIACASPAFAQDYPQFEIAMGYGNLGLKMDSFSFSGRHSGFASHQAFNLSSVFAIENYFGYYGLGENPTLGGMQLLANMFGGKVSYRSAGPVIYGSAGLGGGWIRLPDIGAGTQNAFAVRFGGGVDIPINDSLAWKVDVSRMSFHFDDGVTSWKSGVNVSTGIVLKISQ